MIIEAGRKFNKIVRAFGRKVSSRCLWIFYILYMWSNGHVFRYRGNAENDGWWWWISVVMLFCLSSCVSLIPNSLRNSLSRFCVKVTSSLPLVLSRCYFVDVFRRYHFGSLFCFSSWGNLHWLMLWYAHKIIESSTCSTTCFALCSDPRRKCVCMYVELCSFEVLRIFLNSIVSVFVNQPPCPISFHCHQQTFFTICFQCFIYDEKKMSSPLKFISLFPSINYKLRFVFGINLQNFIE